MKIKRWYDLNDYIERGKTLIIYGPRQVGKTTLLKDLLEKSKLNYRYDIGENIFVREILSSGDLKKIGEYVSDYNLIAIDEAQKIPNIGEGLKIINDIFSDKYIITTGSSSFDLFDRVGESLTGRKRVLKLFPVSFIELLKHYPKIEIKEKIEDYLIYGLYPEVVSVKNTKKKMRILREIAESYLLKDVLAYEGIKKSNIITNLLRLLAFQVGSEVSFNEIGEKLGLNYKTVERYIGVLEKSFVIFSLSGFSKNLRKEVTKKKKYYFYDTGIRNAIISNFNPLELRNDTGQLWENLMIIEKLKTNEYKEIYSNLFFWRTWNRQEIDLIEERGGEIFAYEIKWRAQKKIKPPSEWAKSYPESEFFIVNSENFLDFLK